MKLKCVIGCTEFEYFGWPDRKSKERTVSVLVHEKQKTFGMEWTLEWPEQYKNIYVAIRPSFAEPTALISNILNSFSIRLDLKPFLTYFIWRKSMNLYKWIDQGSRKSSKNYQELNQLYNGLTHDEWNHIAHSQPFSNGRLHGHPSLFGKTWNTWVIWLHFLFFNLWKYFSSLHFQYSQRFARFEQTFTKLKM